MSDRRRLDVGEKIRALFTLVGEVVVRKRSGLPVKAKPHRTLGYQFVRIANAGRGALQGLHRVKFYLRYGWMPPEVDHKDGIRANNLFENLRAATKAQNMMNVPARTTRLGLPRGVSVQRSGRYQARAGKTYIGTYDTVEEAAKAARDARRETHGEFFNDK